MEDYVFFRPWTEVNILTFLNLTPWRLQWEVSPTVTSLILMSTEYLGTFVYLYLYYYIINFSFTLPVILFIHLITTATSQLISPSPSYSTYHLQYNKHTYPSVFLYLILPLTHFPLCPTT